MKTNAETVDGILLEISEIWQSQFKLTEFTGVVWLRRLRDLDAELVLAAVDAICNEPGRFPPTPGTIRDRALQIGTGALSAPTGADAWDRVLQWNRETPPAGGQGEPSSIVLTDNERRALKSVGGSWAIAHSSNGDWLRTQFIKRFEELAAAEAAERNATPETKALVEGRASEFVKQLTERMGTK
jgi:hypothetical protein